VLDGADLMNASFEVRGCALRIAAEKGDSRQQPGCEAGRLPILWITAENSRSRQ
jgi:hypothetical protein